MEHQKVYCGAKTPSPDYVYSCHNILLVPLAINYALLELGKPTHAVIIGMHYCLPEVR